MNGTPTPFVLLTAFLTTLFTIPAHAQDFSFANDCVSTIENQTIVLRQNLDPSFGNGQQVQPGDTVAVYTENGTCAGYDVWSGNGDVQIAAAADVALTDPIDGYVAGEDLKFKVYDESQGAMVDIGTNISFESCESNSFPLCTDDGTYQTDMMAFVDGLNNGPLPVELAGFRAQRNGSTVRLTWETTSEQNNAGFDIQVQQPDAPGWTTLSFVEGAGTTTEPQSYRFETEELDYGMHKFRLRQVDQDGSASLSSVQEVDITLDRAFDLSGVYPNPVQSSARIDLAVRDRQQVAVEIYDLLGRRVQNIFDNTLEANRTRTLNLSADGLSSGAYFLRITGETFTETRRITVVQ